MKEIVIAHEQFTFLDVGSGKGRALLLASDYPFHAIVGIELLPELHRQAFQNIARYRSPSQQCFSIDSRCGNARDLEFPSGPLVIYLFNPLPEPDLAIFVSRLEESLRAHPRPCCILYHYPLLEHVLSRSRWLARIAGTRQYSIFVASAPAH